MSRSITVIALLAIVLLQTNLAIAEEPTGQDNPAPTSVATTPGFCDPYFKSGSVTFEVGPTVRDTVPGATMTFVGKVKNSNTYAIPDADILVSIYRVGDFENKNDDTVVDQVLAAENQTITSNSELPLTFTWQVPSDSLGGLYKAAFSLRTGNELAPVDFTDGEAGNTEVFTITNEVAIGSVLLLSQTTKLQGKSYDLDSMPNIELDQPLIVSVSIKNFAKESKTVPLQWSQSAGDSYKKENIRHSKTQVVTLSAGETKVLTYDIQPQSEGLVAVTAVTQDGGVKSLVPVRFVQSGHSASDIVFAGLSGDIFAAGGGQTVFACLKHYDQDLASQHSLLFTLKDSNGNVIHTFENPLTGAGSSEVVSSKFTPKSAYNVATLSVALKYNGVVVEEAVTTYDCAAIDSSKCSNNRESMNIFKEYGMYILLGLAVIALIVALVLHIIKKRRFNITTMLFFGLLLASSLVSLGGVAYAQSCTVGSEIVINDADGFVDMRDAIECQADNYISPAYGGTGMFENYAPCDGGLTAGGVSSNGSCVSRITFEPNSGPADRCVVRGYVCEVAPPTGSPPNAPVITGPTTGIENTNYTFSVSATDNDGDTVRYGLDWDNNGSVDEWLPGSGYVASGASQSQSRSWPTVGSYTFQARTQDSQANLSGWTSHTITINAAPPATADLKVNGSDGPLDVAKNASVTISWSSTNAASCTKWGGSWGSGSTVGVSGSENTTVTASTQYMINCGGVIDTVQVNVVNQPPNPPAITHPTGNAAFGANTTFTITGTDPDSDNVFYEIDWNNDGTYDVATAQVPSGAGAPGVNAWTATGPQTFQARTVDAGGLRSGWTSHVITINAPTSAATATLEASVNGGAWSSADQIVNITDSVSLRWSSTNATNCSGTGSGFLASGTSGSDNVDTPTLGNYIDFQVTCTGPSGDGSDSLRVSTLQLPNLTTSQNQSPQFGTFDPVTGTYSQVTVYFRTQNNGGSDTQSSADYRFEFDLNNDGSYETNVTRTNGIGIVAVAGGENDNETVSGPIPFGTHGVRITADSSGNPGKVSETNEGDNVYTGTVTTAPADPGLSITANPTRVQNGQNTIIDWSATNPYPMNCSLFGPGMATRSFNLQSATAADHNLPAGPITAKSEYTISCEVAGTTFTDTVTVETQGVIEEI